MARLLTLFLLFPLLLWANDQPSVQEITVDLRHPTYRDGVLSTCEGGVIQAPGLRIQAQSLVYTRKTIDGERVVTVSAEGELMVEYGDYAFIGQRLEYDFVTEEGTLTCGRSMMGPWFIGGELITFLPGQCYVIECAYLTTCERQNPEWKLQADCVTIRNGSILLANKVTVRFLQLPIFWLPNFRTSLDKMLDMPITYRGQIGGAVGSFIGLRYRYFSWGNWDMFLRLEYFIDRGPGGGLDFEYCNPLRCAEMISQNYVARDRSINDPKLRGRYRVAGVYHDCLAGARVDARWDKLSDSEMSYDYHLDDFNLYTARRTQLEVHTQRCTTTTNLFTTVRLNNFQSINQELPAIEHSWRPLPLGCTGIISEGRVRASYIDYAFAVETPIHDFASGRLQGYQNFYRPVQWGPVQLLPQLGGTFIFYSNTPENAPKLLTAGRAALDLSTVLWRCYGSTKHLVEPYFRYLLWTTPSVTIPQHYLFTIADGYTLLNYFRVGARSYLISQNACYFPGYESSIDLFTYGFWDRNNIPTFVPKVYLNLALTPFQRIDLSLHSAWDFAHNRLDHANVRVRYTYSESGAVAAEFRHRSRYAWRKADYENFVLDSFIPESVLLDSGLSDRRNTLLLHFFIRVTPLVTAEVETRHGWDRIGSPNYNEGKIAVVVPLRCRWFLRLAYEHTEYDDSFSAKLTLGQWRKPRAIRQLRVDPLGL